jgi:phage baseplate assembly protein W
MQGPTAASAFLGVGWAFPVAADAGRVRVAAYEEDVAQAIRIILGTDPGERVMRPDFGSGLLAVVFEPNSTVLAATTQMLVQGALQQYLGNLIAVEAVDVEAVDSTFRVSVRYVVRRDGTVRLDTFAPGSAT